MLQFYENMACYFLHSYFSVTGIEHLLAAVKSLCRI